jgi:hypothetical protein
MEMIEPQSNSGLNGMNCGTDTMARFWKPEKSTLPMQIAAT